MRPRAIRSLPLESGGVTRTVRWRSSVFRSVRERLRTPPFFLGGPALPGLPLETGTSGVNKTRQAMAALPGRWALLPKNEAGLGSIRDQ